MAHEQIIGAPLKLFLQAQQRFDALKEHLDVPAHPVDPDDVGGLQRQIGREQTQPLVFLRAMTNKDDRHRNSRSQFGTDQTKDVAILSLHRERSRIQLFQIQPPVAYEIALVIVLDHADDMQPAGAHFPDEGRVRKPAIHEHIRSRESGLEGSVQHGRNDLRGRTKGFHPAFVAMTALIDPAIIPLMPEVSTRLLR